MTVELLLSDTLLNLAAYRIDLALRATSGALPDMGYRAIALIEFRLGLYTSPAYLTGRSAPQSPSALETHELNATREPSGALPS